MTCDCFICDNEPEPPGLRWQEWSRVIDKFVPLKATPVAGVNRGMRFRKDHSSNLAHAA